MIKYLFERGDYTMPYIQSPMEQFNKNNPFVIIAKKTYDTIIDIIHSWTRDYIKQSITIVILYLISSGIVLYSSLYVKLDIDIIFYNIILLIVNIVNIFSYRKKISYYLYEHPSTIAFDTMSKMEINEILVLNNEQMLECIYGLKELHGELKKDQIISSMRFWALVMFHIVGIFWTIFKIWLFLSKGV